MRQGYALVAGIDEVGRGALAGPVMAAAIILPGELEDSWLESVRDSKLLTSRRREYLFELIQGKAVAFGIGTVPSDIIDAVGILHATRLAMRLAIEQLSPAPHFLLIDALRLPNLPIPQKGIIKGDRHCLSIACASILAKVTRDRLMSEMDFLHPGYGLAKNKGYGTQDHLACLRRLDASPIHRKNFSPVRKQLL
ncbi:ribonuclease HII [Chloroflexota bacterium]